MRDADGNVIAVCGTLRDITDVELSAQAALESEQRLQSIIDNTSAAIAVRDRNFRYVLANRAFLERAGLPAGAELPGRPDVEVHSAEAISAMRVGDYRVLAGESILDDQTVTLNGQERIWRSQRFPLTGPHGDITGIADVATDVTDSRAAERELRERIAWEEYISRAVNEGRLLVYSQPIIDVDTGALWGEELLVRMAGTRRPDDVVGPDRFLPQAARFGLMPVIDRFMIDAAMRLARAGRRVCVNVFPSSIQDLDHVEQLLAPLAAEPAVAPNLTFEITETEALASPGVARVFSDRLAALGAGLALDYFGTGYSSFTELRALRLQALKIDLSFVRNLAASPDDQRVVKLIIHIAREFGIAVTAEGVEDAGALELLREYGADRAQGYLIARPAPVLPIPGTSEVSGDEPAQPESSRGRP